MRPGKRRTVERTDQLAVVTAPDQRMPPQGILLFRSQCALLLRQGRQAFPHGMPVRIGNRTGTAAGTASRTGRRLGRENARRVSRNCRKTRSDDHLRDKDKAPVLRRDKQMVPSQNPHARPRRRLTFREWGVVGKQCERDVPELSAQGWERPIRQLPNVEMVVARYGVQ